MKEIRKKIADVLAYIYGIGIALALFGGGLSILGYIVALIVGGQTATDICAFIYKGFYPVLIWFSSAVVLLGLVKMYVAGQSALSAKKDKKKTENQENK